MGSNRSPRGVCSLLKWHGPGENNSRPSYFPRLWFNSRISSCQVDGPGATPAAAPFSLLRCAPARATESPKLSLPGAAPGQRATFQFGVVADKQCTCLASKVMWERYPPTPQIHCGKLDQSTERSLINFDRWVQLPLPLPFSWEAIRLPDCKSGVTK